MKTKILAIALTLLTIASCEKFDLTPDAEKTNQTKGVEKSNQTSEVESMEDLKQKLMLSKWKLVKIEVTTTSSTDDIIQTLIPCKRDDLLLFESQNQLVYESGSAICEGQKPGTMLAGDWELLDSQTIKITDNSFGDFGTWVAPVAFEGDTLMIGSFDGNSEVKITHGYLKAD